MRPHPEWGPFPPVAPFGLTALPAQRVIKPMIFPVIGNSRWTPASYGSGRGVYRHTGIDIKARKMSPIVAPFAGKIGFKRETFWIYGNDGWAILGTHLNDDNPGKHDHKGSRDMMFAPNLVPGQRVRAGQLIGYVGESGNATGPHLHFELYAPGQGPSMKRLRNPSPSLHMAQRIAAPRISAPTACPAKAHLRVDGCVRKVEPSWLTLALVSKQFANGHTVAVSHPRYVRLRLSAKAIGQVGGVEALHSLATTSLIGAIVPSGNLDGATVSRLVLPSSGSN